MLPLALAASVEEAASIVGGAFLGLGAALWFGALLLTRQKVVTREVADGVLVIGTLCLAVALFSQHGRLILALVLLGALALLMVIWLYRSAVLLFPRSPEKEAIHDGTQDEADRDEGKERRKCPVHEASESKGHHSARLRRALSGEAAFFLLVFTTGAAIGRWLARRATR